MYGLIRESIEGNDIHFRKVGKFTIVSTFDSLEATEEMRYFVKENPQYNLVEITNDLITKIIEGDGKER